MRKIFPGLTVYGDGSTDEHHYLYLYSNLELDLAGAHMGGFNGVPEECVESAEGLLHSDYTTGSRKSWRRLPWSMFQRHGNVESAIEG